MCSICRGVFEAVRHELGAEVPLLHDGHRRMTPIQAARSGRDPEPYDLFWLEDCTPAENQEALRLVRQHATTPLAIGEVFNTVWEFKDPVREQLIDYVRGAVHMDGMLHSGDRPGLGVALDVDEAGRYPYEQAYLPYNRLADGTIHDW